MPHKTDPPPRRELEGRAPRAAGAATTTAGAGSAASGSRTAHISRTLKKAIPANGKITKDAKETVHEYVFEFISFITSEVSDKCQRLRPALGDATPAFESTPSRSTSNHSGLSAEVQRVFLWRDDGLQSVAMQPKAHGRSLQVQQSKLIPRYLAICNSPVDQIYSGEHRSVGVAGEKSTMGDVIIVEVKGEEIVVAAFASLLARGYRGQDL